ncbi:MAG: hypothetical protein K0S22_1791 [Oscillospiraceae bacterium]|jgi:hypothetical protein|nr:hypothetical protein [Oscillospiraceae bacterium]
MSKRLPKIGEKCYFMQKEVIIIKVWDYFHLAEIKEVSSEQSLLVDVCTLTLKPDSTNSISLRLFREKTNERFAFY